MRIGFLAGGTARGGSFSPLPATAGEGGAGLAPAVRAAGRWEGGCRSGATRYSLGRASGGGRRAFELVFKLRRIPRRRAALVPVVQQGAGFVDRQPEPFHEHTGRVKRLVMAALAGDGAGNSGEIGGRPTLPVVARLFARWRDAEPRRRGPASAAGCESELGVPCRLSHAARSTGGKTVSSPGVAPRERFGARAVGFHDCSPCDAFSMVSFSGRLMMGGAARFAPGPTPSSVTSRQGRSGRGEPLAFRVPGRPINRAGLTVDVSITTAWSL